MEREVRRQNQRPEPGGEDASPADSPRTEELRARAERLLAAIDQTLDHALSDDAERFNSQGLQFGGQ